MTQPLALFYAGANGAGKSTMRERQAGDYPDMLHLDPDAIAREICPAAPRTVDIAAARETLRRFHQVLQSQHPFSLETTLSGESIFRRMQEARRAGYWVELHYVGLPSSDCNIERVRERAERGLHDIVPDTIRRRYQASMHNIPKALSLANLAMLYDNWERPHHPYLLYHDQHWQVLGQPLPTWLAAIHDSHAIH